MRCSRFAAYLDTILKGSVQSSTIFECSQKKNNKHPKLTVYNGVSWGTSHLQITRTNHTQNSRQLNVKKLIKLDEIVLSGRFRFRVCFSCLYLYRSCVLRRLFILLGIDYVVERRSSWCAAAYILLWKSRFTYCVTLFILMSWQNSRRCNSVVSCAWNKTLIIFKSFAIVHLNKTVTEQSNKNWKKKTHESVNDTVVINILQLYKQF